MYSVNIADGEETPLKIEADGEENTVLRERKCTREDAENNAACDELPKGEGVACNECTANKSEALRNADNDGHASEKTLTRDDGC